MANRIIQSIILIVFCIGLAFMVRLDVHVSEAAMRNLAFINLLKSFLEPTLKSSRYLDRSLKWFNQLSIYDSARYEPYYLRLNGLLETRNDALTNDVTALSEIGSHSGGWELVIGHYLKAIAHSTIITREDIIRELVNLLYSQEAMDDLEHYVYTDLNGRSLFSVTLDECAAVDLIAIYIGESSMAIRQSIPAVVVWRINDLSNLQVGRVVNESFQQQYSQWEWYREGQFLFQVGKVINALPDGTFEQTVLPREGLPLSLPHPIYSSQVLQQTRLVYEFPETGQNIVLLLGNQRNVGEGHSRVGLRSLPIDISLHSSPVFYLIIGRYRTVGEALPHIGIRWLYGDGQELNYKISSYIVRERVADEWLPFAKILSPPLDVDRFEYWVLNVNATAQLYIDDLGVFSISLPCH